VDVNIYDVFIGIIIGLFAERFFSVTKHLQALIKKQKEIAKAKKMKEKNESKT
jgi:hypothetical protein